MFCFYLKINCIFTVVDENDYIKQIGLSIKKIRKANKLTQLDLAALLNIEDSALRRIENGRTNPTIKTLIRIAKVLDIKVTELL